MKRGGPRDRPDDVEDLLPLGFPGPHALSQKKGGIRDHATPRVVHIFRVSMPSPVTTPLTIGLLPGARDHITLTASGFWTWRESLEGRYSGFKRERDSLRPTTFLVNTLSVRDTVFRCVAYRSDVTPHTRNRAVLREEEFLPTETELEEVRIGSKCPQGWEALTVGRRIRREELKDSSSFC